MSDAKYTPGPWRAQYLSADGVVIQHGGWEIATDSYDVVADVPRGAPIRKEADARLIAAAPELLEACRRALQDITINDDHMDGTVAMLTAVVNKAEGR